MESVQASLVKLNGREGMPYALVARPLPDFIPSECVITGEVKVFTVVDAGAKIEAQYVYSTVAAGWFKDD